MNTARRKYNFRDIKLKCDHFRDLLEDPELELSDAQLGRLVKELRALRCIVESLSEDIPFVKLRLQLWKCLDMYEELYKTPGLYIVDEDGNGLHCEAAKEHIMAHIRQTNVLIEACTECGELGR